MVPKASDRQTCYRFTCAMCELPTSGDEIPVSTRICCFLIACACTDASVRYQKMYEILEYSSGVSNLVKILITTSDEDFIGSTEHVEAKWACQLGVGMEEWVGFRRGTV